MSNGDNIFLTNETVITDRSPDSKTSEKDVDKSNLMASGHGWRRYWKVSSFYNTLTEPISASVVIRYKSTIFLSKQHM